MSGIIVLLDHDTHRQLLREASREKMAALDLAREILEEGLKKREALGRPS